MAYSQVYKVKDRAVPHKLLVCRFRCHVLARHSGIVSEGVGMCELCVVSELRLPCEGPMTPGGSLPVTV